MRTKEIINKRNRVIVILFFLLFPLFSVCAIMTLELAVNDELKQCQTFQPTKKVKIPNGWRYYKCTGSNYLIAHKTECESLGYTYIERELKGEINSTYLAIVIVYNSLFLIVITSLLIYFFKTKKRKYIIVSLFVLLVYLLLYSMIEFIF